MLRDTTSEITSLLEQLTTLKRSKSKPAGVSSRSTGDYPEHIKLKRFRSYTKNIRAISGQGGGNRTLQFAGDGFRFALNREQVWSELLVFNETRCEPPWSEKDLLHKLDDAEKLVNKAGEVGKLLAEGNSYSSHTEDPSYDPSGILGNDDEEAATASIAGLFLPAVAKNWRSRFESLNEPPRFPTGLPFEFGPGSLLLLGAGPGAGKSTLATQCGQDALLNDGELRVLIVNVEQPPEDIYARQLALHSGVKYGRIRYPKDLDEDDRRRLDEADADLQSRIGDRLRYVTASDFASIKQAVKEHRTGVLVLDYLQRIRLPSKSDKRQEVDELLAELRELCHQGLGVLAISSLGRPQKRGDGYSSYDITSFKESGEIEYGADEAYILKREKFVPGATQVTLKAVKLRHRPIDEGDIRLIQGDSLRFALVESDISAILTGEPDEVAS